MKKENQITEVALPKKQQYLFGHESYFNYFTKLIESNKMPNSILFSGSKGTGKATFAYHVINYLLSKSENEKYSIENYFINEKNLSYNLLNQSTHPNFYLIENNFLEKDIKIEQIRDLFKFLNKTTFSKNLKIVMIDNAENLNLFSSNALLKVIEETQKNTFFFIIHNNSYKILETIKSRCIEFKFFLTKSQRKNIFKKLVEQYKVNFDFNSVSDDYIFDTPGNLVKYFIELNNAKINMIDDKLSCIDYFIDKFTNEKDPESLTFLSLFIEKYYNDLYLSNSAMLNTYIINQSKALGLIQNIRRFNLDGKNVLICIRDILHNEKQ